METLSDRIEDIFQKMKELNSKLEKLKSENKRLYKDKEQLTNELQKSRANNEALGAKIEEMAAELKAVRQGGGVQSEELKKEIDQYITAIDQCIDWLHNN